MAIQFLFAINLVEDKKVMFKNIPCTCTVEMSNSMKQMPTVRWQHYFIPMSKYSKQPSVHIQLLGLRKNLLSICQ